MATNRRWTDSERRIWNRAIYLEEPDLREGDRALGALLHVDGYIQNGGVGHAFDLPQDELAEGIKGYKYFGLHAMAEVIQPHRGEEESNYNSRYYQFTRGENAIIKAFQKMFAEHPERFTPLGETAAG